MTLVPHLSKAFGNFLWRFFRKKSQVLYCTRLTHTTWEESDVLNANVDTTPNTILRIGADFVGITLLQFWRGGNIPWSCVRCQRKTKGMQSHARARGFLCHICRNERNRRFWK